MAYVNTNHNHVICPLCKSDTWKFGKDPHSGLQRFRCKNPSCKRQFVPGKPLRIKEKPHVFCPRCGSRMHIFKSLSDGIRFRCNNYQKKDHSKCNHKINIPLPGCSFTIVSDPIEAIDTDLPIPFYWNKMDFSKSTVSLALYFAVFKSLPAPEVVDIMNTIFNINISHDSITRWTHKASLNVHKNLGPLTVPYSKNKRLFVDETQFSVRGHKRWVWAGKDSKFDSMQSWYLSPRRSTEYARNLFNIAFTKSPSLRKASVVSDGLWSYPSALGDLDFDVDHNHICYVGWDKGAGPDENNNRLERHWSTLKTYSKRFRGFKSDLGLWAFVTNQVYLHNYFKPNHRLKGKTPAQAAKAKLPYCFSLWKLFTKIL